MKMTLQHLVNLSLVLIVINPAVLAQNGNASVSSGTTIQSKAKASLSKVNELRERHLRVLREHILTRIIENVKGIDEAGLRLSARNQMLSYLANDKTLTDQKHTLATQIARDAVADLREHGEEILPFMFGYLSADLGSWIQKHRPNLTDEFEKAIKASAKVDSSQHIRSLFELKNGEVLAVKRIQQELEEQGTLSGLYFWLDELMRRRSKEFEPLALDIIIRAERAQISFETLFWISEVYLKPQISAKLRDRFLAAVVARTQLANFTIEPPGQMAYQLLTTLLPFVQQSTPELYDQALNQSLAMKVSLDERTAAIEARLKRLSESANPIEDLVSEARSTKSRTEQNELLLQAAQLALEKKKLDLCLHILSEVDLNVRTPGSDPWERSIDQILKNVAKDALVDRHTELAEKAASLISSSLTRVETLNLIMRYFAKVNDKSAAQRLLIEAARVAGSGPDSTEKAKAFFLLSFTCDQVDGSKKADLLLSGIKALNSLSKPDTNARDKTIYQDYVRRLDNSGYELTKGFKGLTTQDENSALALVERLQKPDLRTFALIGILQGLDGLLTEPPG